MSEEIDFMQVRKGDRIKVTHTLEGMVCDKNEDRMDVLLPNGERALLARIAPVWEYVIERIEPEYVPGGIYCDADGVIYVYEPDSFFDRPWRTANSASILACKTFDYPERPMTRLEKRQ